MKKLNKLYEQQMKDIAQSIQDSEILEAYLEEEDEEIYKELVEAFEPAIEEVYINVALQEPLSLLELEDVLLDESYEGLFLPRLLGYNILRAGVDETYKYSRSNDRLGVVLKCICDSANFEIIKNRIGQSIQVGFALSSDIWITGFVDQISNKKIKQYLNAQKLPKYLHQAERLKSYNLYQLQFAKFNFYTTEFPQDITTQRLHFHTLSTLLKERAVINQHNESFVGDYIAYLENETFHHTKEHTIVLGLLINYYDLKAADQKKISKILNKVRSDEAFNEIYFNFVLERFNSKLKLTADSDRRVSALVDFKQADDELTRYYTMASTLAEMGYMHEDTIEQIRNVYGMYEGMSLFNECVRMLVLGHFDRFINNLDPTDYHEYFELDKYVKVYIDIFNNQQFSQKIRDFSVAFVKRCMKEFTDKRGREYQDVKKFITQQYLDLQFMRDKEIAEIFKSKRKKKA